MKRMGIDGACQFALSVKQGAGQSWLAERYSVWVRLRTGSEFRLLNDIVPSDGTGSDFKARIWRGAGA